MLVRVMAAIESLSEGPRPIGVKKLVGSEHTYRIRVGDYRIVYSIEDRLTLLLVQRIVVEARRTDDAAFGEQTRCSEPGDDALVDN